MNQKILLGWAISATALALLFLGYALGKQSAPATQVASPALYAPGQAATDGGDPQAQPVDPYVVPKALAAAPTEWHSVTDDKSVRGYAVLFDPQRREVIVEQCHHRGYVDQRTGDVVEQGWEFCDNVLWGTLATIDESSAIAIQRGQPVELALDMAQNEGEPRLSLSFQDHDMVLEPGSKNDYLQALENTPQMLRQKDTYLKAMVAREQAVRRVTQQTGSEPRTTVPTYSLPESDTDRDGQDEPAPTQ